jgi:hypothetical protein
MLQRNRWLPDTSGSLALHTRHFPTADLTAFINAPGLSFGAFEEPQELAGVWFVRGQPRGTDRLKLREVDPLVLSDVLSFIDALIFAGG